MAHFSYPNYYIGLPETKVCLLYSDHLESSMVRELGIFSSIAKESNHILITDTVVERLYLPQLLSCLLDLGIRAHPIVAGIGEKNKTLQNFTTILTECMSCTLGRDSTILSFGGGVVKYLAGFLASTLFRGVNLVHIPTTLLAQVDAAVDWKQALNLSEGKNLLGTMYSPSEIWINPAFLRSLDLRWIRDGLAESVKIALCCSPEFLDLLSEGSIHDQTWLSQVVQASISLKVNGLRRNSALDEAVKQYGHSIGHAIEHLSAARLGHGESVAIGMCVSAELGILARLTDDSTVQKHYEIFKVLGLPTTIPVDQSAEVIWKQVHLDKYFLRDSMHTSIVKSIGEMAMSEEQKNMIPFTRDMVVRAIEQNIARTDCSSSGSRAMKSGCYVKPVEENGRQARTLGHGLYSNDGPASAMMLPN